MFQDHSINALFFEQIDVLALLYFICDIEKYSFFFLLFFCIFCAFCFFYSFRSIFFFVFCNKILKSQIFAVEVFEQQTVFDAVIEFVIFDAAVFDERADIIPVFLIIFTVGLAHAGQFVCNFLADIFRNFLYSTVVLQCTSGNVQRQIRTIDHTF